MMPKTYIRPYGGKITFGKHSLRDMAKITDAMARLDELEKEGLLTFSIGEPQSIRTSAPVVQEKLPAAAPETPVETKLEPPSASLPLAPPKTRALFETASHCDPFKTLGGRILDLLAEKPMTVPEMKTATGYNSSYLHEAVRKLHRKGKAVCDYSWPRRWSLPSVQPSAARTKRGPEGARQWTKLRSEISVLLFNGAATCEDLSYALGKSPRTVSKALTMMRKNREAIPFNGKWRKPGLVEQQPVAAKQIDPDAPWLVGVGEDEKLVRREITMLLGQRAATAAEIAQTLDLKPQSTNRALAALKTYGAVTANGKPERWCLAAKRAVL